MILLNNTNGIHRIPMVSKDIRVTIMLDAELAKKLRDRQAKLIQQRKNSVSFSRVLNEVLGEGFKKVRA